MSGRRIEDYALIGDCETAALVHRDGGIEWLCWPNFGSPAAFAKLLGDDDNGVWRLSAAEPARVSRRYRDDTLILETRYETGEGAATVVDFMPIRRGASHLMRIVIGERGAVTMASAFRVRFDYGRMRPLVRREEGRTIIFQCGRHGARLHADIPLALGEGGACDSEFTIAAGETRALVLTYFPSYEAPPEPIDPRAALAETERFWREWSGRCGYRGPWRDAVMRSLITLKALVYRPSGAIVAAPTSSLPEQATGEGLWDYRFCWLRDATFTLLSFLHAGYVEEAAAWRDWLLRAVAGEPGLLQPVFGLDGEPRLHEWSAPWLSGFNGAKPVRFGNAAYRQRQFDAFGEVIDALHQAGEHGVPEVEGVWQLRKALADELARCWREPGNGIWEKRDGARLFTLSRAMIWAALDRTIRFAEREGREAPLERWREARDAVHAETCRRGFRAERGAFVRDFDSDALDASLLLLPQIGFLPPSDPRIVGTVEAIGRELSADGFIRRHERAEGGGSAFVACGFWYADALAIIGRRAQAEAMFARLMAIRNDLGLLSEQYDPDERRLMGNFPQTLSHLALVNAAFNLWTDDPPAGRRSQLKRRSAS